MTNKQRAERTHDMLIGAMLFIIVGIMPLVVRAAIRPVPPEAVDIFAGNPNLFMYHGRPSYLDFFSYWKGFFLTVPALVIAFYYISDFLTGGRKFDIKPLLKNPVVIASAVFLFFTFLSAILSDYRHTAWFGAMERREGALMWGVYFIAFFGTMRYVREPKHVKPILWGLIFSSIIMGAIGLSQFLYNDFFATDLAQRLIIGSDVRQHFPEGIRIEFTIAFGTLYNPNPFGLYTAMLAPILLITALTYQGNKIINALLLIAGALMLTGVFGSRSLGGAIGLAAAVAVIIITLLSAFIYRLCTGKIEKRPPNRNEWLFISAGGALLAGIAAAAFFITPINNRLTLQWERFQTAIHAQPRPVQDIFFEGDTMTVYIDDERLFSATVEVDISPNAAPIPEGVQWLTIRNSDGTTIPIDRIIPRENYTRYEFLIQENRRIAFDRWGTHFIHQQIVFACVESQIFGVAANGHLIDMTERIPAFGFRGREHWGTNRGYIISRTLPLLPQNMIFGTGPDSYVYTFPQHDLVGKRQGMDGNPYKIVDKAHNIYLHTWVGNGGIATLALIFVFGHFLLTTLLYLIRTAGTGQLSDYGLRLGLLAVIVAYGTASLATDSTVASTGVFFVLLGAGYGISTFTSASASDTALSISK
ncbi:MAG: O-antigen ligase family protein [Defluviitaleaceae bacterium]|nr:O-antigen ligase family protein [Defluviitaleaceae bacterium]MCL2275254.1 O-antigen ligase family protein [Defluviitaleaceae bacterium]